MKIASVEFIPLSLPLAAPFHPAWFPNVTQKSADGTLIKVHTDEGIVGYGWQNSFGSEIKTVGESRVFKDLVVGTDLFNVENLIRVLSGIMYSMNTVLSLGRRGRGLGRDRESLQAAYPQAAGRSSGKSDGLCVHRA